MSFAYPSESSALSDIVGRDGFLKTLNDQALRVHILETEPNNLDDALNMASRLEVFDIMGSTGPEAEKGGMITLLNQAIGGMITLLIHVIGGMITLLNQVIGGMITLLNQVIRGMITLLNQIL